jgi:hypothetical protein
LASKCANANGLCKPSLVLIPPKGFKSDLLLSSNKNYFTKSLLTKKIFVVAVWLASCLYRSTYVLGI